MSLIIDSRKWEDMESLKKHLSKGYGTVNTIKSIVPQLTTASAVELSEKGAETITFLTADADLFAFAENNHADGLGLAISGTVISSTGVALDVTGALDATDSSASEAFEATTASYRIRELNCITTANTGYVAVGNTGQTEIYGIVEQGKSQSIHSRYMTPVNRRAVLGRIHFSAPSLLGFTIGITYTPKSTGIEYTYAWNFVGQEAELFIGDELEALSEVTLTILKVVDSNHVTATVTTEIVEAY